MFPSKLVIADSMLFKILKNKENEKWLVMK